MCDERAAGPARAGSRATVATASLSRRIRSALHARSRLQRCRRQRGRLCRRAERSRPVGRRRPRRRALRGPEPRRHRTARGAIPGAARFAGGRSRASRCPAPWSPSGRPLSGSPPATACSGSSEAAASRAGSSSTSAIAQAFRASLDELESAAVPEAFVTAHDAVMTQAGLRPGELLVVNGANGGVGTAAMQIAAVAGRARPRDGSQRRPRAMRWQPSAPLSSTPPSSSGERSPRAAPM